MYKKYFDGKKGVFFDLDGTIIDSIPYWKDAFMKVLEEVNYLEEARDTFVDRGSYVTEIWKYIKRLPGVEIELPVKELTQKTYKAYLELFSSFPLEPRDGFWSLVGELKEKGFKLALVSNSDMEVVNPVITMIDMKEGVFDLIMTGDQVRKRKPHPAIYKKALRKLKLHPKQVLVFEDSVSGSQSAKKAGLETIAIWDGQVVEREYPRNVKEFLPDFSSFPGNLDATYLEHAQEGIELLEQETL
jgi:HAD superfamily hydrolase (TIGR01509 family)